MVFGAGGGTSSYREIEETDLIVLWGSNARETHPIFFHHLLRGVRNGARLYAVDPRRTSSAEWADVWLGLDVGSDIALANAIGREIIASGLEDRAFTQWLLAACAASGRVRGVSAGHLHNGFAAERAGIGFWTCPSGWLDLDFDAGTIVPPGYRYFQFHNDGTIESTMYLVDDPRYAERPPYPEWVPKVLAGLERD